MTDYQTVAAQLARVRRAWKRAAALSGLTVTVLEAIGLITLALVVDLLFGPGLVGRVVILAGVIAAVLWLLGRHVLAPLSRKINDRQIALFVEERNPAFEGALIAAAEFGPTAHLDPQHQAIIEAIIHEAEMRAKRFDLRGAVDLKRLKKYGMLAVAVAACYGLVAAVFPDTVTRHAQRVLTPWHADSADIAAGPQTPDAPPPINITLSRTDDNLLRGTKFELEATLTRDPAGPVRFHFRSLTEADDATADEGVWHALTMDSVEKLHGYAMALPDVNEPIEFYVSAETYQSVRGRITVYDPLVIEALELVTHFPEYLELPDRTEVSPNGDVAAPEGSAVTLRIETNRPLASGTLTWEGGETVAMTIDPADNTTATINFPVNEDLAFRYRIEDIGGQVAQSAAPANVAALPDLPPTMELIRPTSFVRLTPLGEVTFEAEVADDWGVAGVELVYQRGIVEGDTPKHRVPLGIHPSERNPTKPGALTAMGVWQMETMEPVVGFGDVFTYYLEVKDRKGQTALTPVQIAGVSLYEVWTVENWIPMSGGAEPLPPEVLPLLQAVWMLHQQKPTLAPTDFDQQVDELAAAFVNPGTGEVWAIPAITPETPAGLIPILQKFQGMFRESYGTMQARDTKKTIDILQSLVTQMIALGLVDVLEAMPPMASEAGATASEFRAEAERLADLETQLPDAPPPDPQAAAAAKAAQAAKDAADAAAQAAKEQQDVVDKAKDQAKQDNPADKDRKKLADQQKGVADKTKAIADDLAKNNPNDKKLNEAAKNAAKAAENMHKAAEEMRTGRMEKAVAQAEQAKQDLDKVAADLQQMARQKLADMLADAEHQAQRLLNKQKDLQRRTEKADADQKKQPQDAAARDRDFKVLAAEQARAKGDLDKLEQAVTKLTDAVQQGTVKRETAKHITDTRQNLRRGRVEQKITGAAVELAKQNAKTAGDQQQQATEALDKVLKSIQAAGDSLAADYEAELERARREAKQLTDAIAKANPEAAKKADPNAPQSKPDPTAEQRRENAEEAAGLVDRVQRHVAARDFVDKATMQKLAQEAGDLSRLAGRVEKDEAQAFGLLKAARAVEAELEEVYQRHQEAKRIFTAQREDCPPEYRELVNQYFQTLSKENR